jgi:hypothetical protein
MKIVTPPHRVDFMGDTVSIFLAGSIEMGEATEWQKKVIEMLDSKLSDEFKEKIQILNPRRADWDSNWKQDYENPQFFQQVVWELKGLENCTCAIVYFDPGTKSPISLLELGAFRDKCIVVCPEGFWRKGNVDIFCEHFDIPQYKTLEEAIEYIIEKIQIIFGHEN